MNTAAHANSQRFYDRLSFAVISGYAVVIALLIGAAIWYALQTRSERLASAIATTNTLVRALDEHVHRAIDAVDVLISDVAVDIVGAGRVSAFSEQQLHQMLKTKLALIPQSNSLFVYTPDLMLYAGSGSYPVPRIDGRKFEHVTAHVGSATSFLHVGKPHINPVRQSSWAIPVTRRINDKDGNFLGIIGAIVDQDHFYGFYRELGLSSDQAVGLIRTDGIVLFRFPQIEGLKPGTDLSHSSPVFTQGALKDVQTLQFNSPVDGEERIVTYRRLDDLGLLVTFAQEVDALLAPWRRNTALIAVGVVITLAALTVLLLVALRQIRRRAADERQLSEMLERKVQERTAELKTANDDLESFSYSVSHDLRTPLNVIGGYIYLLRHDRLHAPSPAAVGMLEEMDASVKHMTGLINDLLNLARISREQVSKALVDLSGLADEIVAELARNNPARQIDIAIMPGVSVQADAGLIRIALQNLLSNAWKYTTKTSQPRIEFGTELNGSERVFYVRDNGAGFDMNKADKLFRPFQRLHDQQEFEGTGVGLATVARAIQRQGGRVWARAAPQQGATFLFTLPDT